jgi:hypothetical protein
MRLSIFLISVFVISSCYSDKDNCRIPPFSREEISKIRDSLGIISSTRFKRYDLTKIAPLTFIRYLSSVEVFEELNELEVTSYRGNPLITPFFLEPEIKASWIDQNSKNELFKLICSKQPAVPTMNRNASSLPNELSTVGIEVMHLLHYSEGNESAYVSNRAFCTLEKQDSMVLEFWRKYQ